MQYTHTHNLIVFKAFHKHSVKYTAKAYWVRRLGFDLFCTKGKEKQGEVLEIFRQCKKPNVELKASGFQPTSLPADNALNLADVHMNCCPRAYEQWPVVVKAWLFKTNCFWRDYEFLLLFHPESIVLNSFQPLYLSSIFP